MKKIITCMLICSMLLCSGYAYAEENGIAPCYNIVSASNTSISSVDDGVAMNIWVFVTYATSLD